MMCFSVCVLTCHVECCVNTETVWRLLQTELISLQYCGDVRRLWCSWSRLLEGYIKWQTSV